jgi:hypothetical protein
MADDQPWLNAPIVQPAKTDDKPWLAAKIVKPASETRQANARPADSMLVSAAKATGSGASKLVFGAEELAGRGLEALGYKTTGKKLVDQAQLANRAVDYAMAPDRAAHPIAVGAGEIAGTAAVPLGVVGKAIKIAKPAAEAADAAWTAARAAEGTEAAAGLTKAAQAATRQVAVRSAQEAMARGAAVGATGGALQPTDGQGNFLAQKVTEIAAGALAGEAIGGVAHVVTPYAARAVGKLAAWATNLRDQAGAMLDAPKPSLQDKAAKIVLARIAANSAAGGPTAQDMLDLAVSAEKKGIPLAPVDVGGKSVQALAGKVYRQGGEAQSIIKNALTQRDAGAGERLNRTVSDALGAGSVRETAKTLAEARSMNARPLWEKAMAGGSMAPLQQSLEKQVAELGEVGTKAQKEITKSQGYLGRLTRKDVSAKQYHNDNIAQQQAILREAQAKQQGLVTMLERAKADGTANAPGAVWSPRLQQFMDEPIVRAGINRGLKIERQTALAEGRPMNPTDYAIVGMENGEPVVGTVPTMKLLQTAKEGIDRVMETPEMRDPLTGRLTKDGIAVDKVRRAFLGELDRLNPDYKAARDQWSGDTSSIQALKTGQEILQHAPEEIREMVGAMTDNERQFARLGAAGMLKEMVNKAGVHANEARLLVRSQHMKDQLLPLFESEAKYKDFIDSVMHEQSMFETNYQVMGNSLTAERAAEDKAAGMLPAGMAPSAKAAAALAAGRYGAAVGHAIQAVKEGRGAVNPELNAAIARILVGAAGPGAESSAGSNFLRRALPLANSVANVPQGGANSLAAQLAAARAGGARPPGLTVPPGPRPMGAAGALAGAGGAMAAGTTQNVAVP